MEYIATWTALVMGTTLLITDHDHPGPFPTKAACEQRVKYAAPKFTAMLKGHFGPTAEVWVNGECKRQRRRG